MPDHGLWDLPVMAHEFGHDPETQQILSAGKELLTLPAKANLWRLDGALERIDDKIAELRRTRRLLATTMQECRTGYFRFASQLDVGASAG
jgi:hypothetical protein